MTRKDLFDAIRPFAPAKSFSQAHVASIDALADSFGLPRDTGGLTASQGAINLIKRFEGCKLTAYPDPGTGGDPWTIGWGSTGPDIKKGTVWTQEQADSRLKSDVSNFAQGVAALVAGSPTSQWQFDAMVSLAYNIGLGAFGKSTLLKLHKDGNYAAASNEFGKWVNAGGKKMQGLVNRRAVEAKVYKGLGE